jgi:multidrug efflux pump subunit AcrA (membrane-fusion protein)
MRYIEPNQPQPPEVDVEGTLEEKLRKENEDLKRQLQELKGSPHAREHTGIPTRLWHPSRLTIIAIFLAATATIIVAFVAGYLPRQRRQSLIVDESQQREQALPRVEVTEAGRSEGVSKLELPGNIQPITEAPLLARTDGYVRRRLVDIGDRVRAGQLVAEIEAPELDQQVRQAQASVQQAESALDQALANLEQGRADMEYARVTAQRWGSLVQRGVVSRQENDRYQAQYRSQSASVRALEKAVAAQRSNVAAAEANLARLREMQGFRLVKAPFEGVITQRNVDVGALVNAGSTLLFRIAQTGMLRTYVNVPQVNAGFIRTGQPARLRISSLPGRAFPGTVARTANALDPSSRTMLVEVHVPNTQGALLPGMYAQVDLSSPRSNPAVLIPSDALIVRADGTTVAVVRPDHTIHIQKIQVGRDYGDRLEVIGGIEEGTPIVRNPGDLASEGLKVDPVQATEKNSAPRRSQGAK